MSRRSEASESRGRRDHRDRRRDRDSRSRSRGRGDSRGGDRSRSRDRRGRGDSRDRSRSRSRERGSKRSSLENLTKDQRTLFVGQLTSKVEKSHVWSYFERMGKVREVILLRDKQTGKHKGYAYVEMADLEDIPSCLEINDCIPDFQNFPILVKPSEAEKNRASAVAAAGGLPQGGATGAGLLSSTTNKATDPCRVYITNIHPFIDHQCMHEIMSFYGQVEAVKFVADTGGKTFAFVRFATPEAATDAVVSLNGFIVGHLKLLVQHAKS